MNNSANKKDIVILKSPDTYDLSCHGVIEASAGTGKTYNISNLVVRILVEKNCPIDRILVMTFTEKATGELLQEVYTQIKIAANRDGLDFESKHRLQQAIIDFDKAQIFTIHSFCQTVLSKYSLLNKEVMDLEVCSDREVYEETYHRIQAALWPLWYGEYLPLFLDLVDFSINDRSTLKKQIVGIAEKLYFADSSELNDRIIPERGDSSKKVDFDFIDNVRAKLLSFLEAKGISFAMNDGVENHPLYVAFDASKINGRSHKKPTLLCVENLLKWLYCREDEAVQTFSGFIKNFIGSGKFHADFSENGFHVLISNNSWNSKAGSEKSDMIEIWGGIEEILSPLCKVFDEAVNLKIKTIYALREEASAWKKQKGLISFDDMLSRLVGALRNDGKGQAEDWLLHRELWQNYRFALIDEFQDTDRVQWEILKRIFIDYPEALGGKETHPLTLIGDPKQAIYSFRGADVETYLDAVSEVTKYYNGKYYSLNTSFRSTPELVEAFNVLFESNINEAATSSENSHFFSPGDGISYTSLACAGEKLPSVPVFSQSEMQSSHRKAVTVVSFDEVEQNSRDEKDRLWAQWVADEIARILYGNDGFPVIRVREGRGGNFHERDLTARDIAILVRSSKEAAGFENALSKHIPHVPVTIYKKEGLYQTSESNHLKYLFEALLYSTDFSVVRKALLTPFFRFELEDVLLWEELSCTHQAKSKFIRWKELARKHKWTEFFAEILYESGAMYEFGNNSSDQHGSVVTLAGLEQRREIYRQITERLLADVSQKQVGLSGIIKLLDKYQRSECGCEEDVHRIESASPKVQVLTMHSSKGLEYPVVFLSRGADRDYRHNAFYRYHEICNIDGREKTRIVYDLEKSCETQFKKEIDEENRRILYVAMTRPRFRLYLPEFEADEGMVGKYITPILKDPVKTNHNICRVSVCDREYFKFNFRDKKSDDSQTKSILSIGEIKRDNYLWLRKFTNPVASFSSLALLRNRNHTEESRGCFREGDEKLRERHASGVMTYGIIAEEPVAFYSDNIDDLPLGADTGNALHDFFEKISFADVKSKECLISCDMLLADSIIELIHKYNIFVKSDSGNNMPPDHIHKKFADIIWNTLQAELPVDDGSIVKIGDIPDCSKIHEAEFFCSVLNDQAFLSGFIDMVFIHNNKFYILDWKSNFIADGYSFKKLEQCMLEHHYDLQYKCYVVALASWLKSYYGISEDKFDEVFGGIYYVFLRGATQGSSSGIYARIGNDKPALKGCRFEVSNEFQLFTGGKL